MVFALPPFSSIFTVALLLKASALTVTVRSRDPFPNTLTGFFPFTRPDLTNSSRVITSPSPNLFKSLTFIMSYFSVFLLVKPRLGDLSLSAVCPPSNHAETLPPDLAFWPLCPFPLVFPVLPVPQPTLFLFFFEPGWGDRVLSIVNLFIQKFY